MKIDINSDLGEGFGAYRMGDDEALLDIVSSANVACGYHAGDPVIMDRTVRQALVRGVDVGAHVSYPDLMGFGRRPMQMVPLELEKHILYQLGALHAMAVAAGTRVAHLNAHGALGNQVSADAGMAATLVRAVKSFDPGIAILCLPGTPLDHVAQDAGMRAVHVFLADRAYDKAGQLVPRGVDDAVIKDKAAVLARVVRLLESGTIETLDGHTLKVSIHSILVHSDTPGAVALATTIRQAIVQAGAQVTPLSKMIG